MRIVLLFISIIGTISTLGAQSFPKGMYLTFDEVKERSPSDTSQELIVTKRTKADIFMMGGNDFKIQSPDGSVSKTIIKRKMVAYSDGTTLYTNCFPLKCQNWYGKAVSVEDSILVFEGAASTSRAIMAGTMGGAIGGAAVASERYLYKLNLETGEVKLNSRIK